MSRQCGVRLVGIMHELRKDRSTVDHAPASAQLLPPQLHHNHQSSHLAMALNTSHTSKLAGSGVWKTGLHISHAFPYRCMSARISVSAGHRVACIPLLS
jgi:hypothetical protein